MFIHSSTTIRETFPFFDCDYDSLITETFNSNYDCKCNGKTHLEHNNPEKSYDILLNLNELNCDTSGPVNCGGHC